jgi:hypothetical protein
METTAPKPDAESLIDRVQRHRAGLDDAVDDLASNALKPTDRWRLKRIYEAAQATVDKLKSLLDASAEH